MGRTRQHRVALSLIAYGLSACYSGSSREPDFRSTEPDAAPVHGEAVATQKIRELDASPDCDACASTAAPGALEQDSNPPGDESDEHVTPLRDAGALHDPLDAALDAAPHPLVDDNAVSGEALGAEETPGEQAADDALSDVDAAPDIGAGDAAPDLGAGNALPEASPWCDEGCPELLDLQGGRDYICGLFEGGLVKCWGRDDRGQLGRASEGVHQMWPAAVEPIDFGTDREVVQISAGGNHVCVRFEDRRARCWGANDFGQLGIGSTADYGDQPLEPIAELPDLNLSDVTDIAAGGKHTCVLREPQDAPPSVHCFGINDSGESALGEDQRWGHDEPIDDSRPVDLGGAIPLSVHVGSDASCVRLAEGGIRCWGYSVHTGRPAGSNNRLPPNTDEYNPITDLWINGVSAEHKTWCAWTEVDLRCWGFAQDERFSIPDDSPDLVREALIEPMTIDIGSLEISQVVYGRKSGCVLSQGRVYCFGVPSSAGYGGAFDTSLTPAQNWAQLPHQGAVDFGDADGVDGLDPIERVFVADINFCVKTTLGELRCFGRNDWGQLGYGFAEQDGSELGTVVSTIGDDETPAQAYELIGTPAVQLW